MDKYLKAIEEAEKRIRIYHEATLKACKETNTAYTMQDSKRISNRAWEMLQGIRFVATYDDDIKMDEWDKIVKKCMAVLDPYEKEYDALLKKEFSWWL